MLVLFNQKKNNMNSCHFRLSKKDLMNDFNSCFYICFQTKMLTTCVCNGSEPSGTAYMRFSCLK